MSGAVRAIRARSRDACERTFAVDGSFPLASAAERAGGNVRSVQADAARLPFRDGGFELVTAYNVLMDLDDLEASLGEFARVLADGGHLAACVLHPTAEAGSFEARVPGARFVIDVSYFDEGSYAATFGRRGREIKFSRSRYTLETYIASLRRTGFVIEAAREPAPDPHAVVRDPSEERWTRVPLFLFLLAVKLHPSMGPNS